MFTATAKGQRAREYFPYIKLRSTPINEIRSRVSQARFKEVCASEVRRLFQLVHPNRRVVMKGWEANFVRLLSAGGPL